MGKGKQDKTNPTDIKGINGILLDLSNFFAKTKIITKISTVIISKNTHNDNCKKQLEKVAINSDENSLKIETLENKIQSLEIALKKALEDKN